MPSERGAESPPLGFCAGQRERREARARRSEAGLSVEDLGIGTHLQGVVRNVVAFGAFVDIGVGRASGNGSGGTGAAVRQGAQHLGSLCGWGVCSITRNRAEVALAVGCSGKLTLGGHIAHLSLCA